MAGQDEAMATLAAMLKQQPPTADEQGSSEEWGSAKGGPTGDKLKAMRLAHEAETGGKPDFERTLRIMDALVPGDLGSQRGPGVAPIPKGMVLPDYIKQQMPVGVLMRLLKEGDLDRPVVWLDPNNPEHQRMYAEHMAGGSAIVASKPKAPAQTPRTDKK